jgi:hypothetical protein
MQDAEIQDLTRLHKILSIEKQKVDEENECLEQKLVRMEAANIELRVITESTQRRNAQLKDEGKRLRRTTQSEMRSIEDELSCPICLDIL